MSSRIRTLSSAAPISAPSSAGPPGEASW
jgi:hypothetical protein